MRWSCAVLPLVSCWFAATLSEPPPEAGVVADVQEGEAARVRNDVVVHDLAAGDAENERGLHLALRQHRDPGLAVDRDHAGPPRVALESQGLGDYGLRSLHALRGADRKGVRVCRPGHPRVEKPHETVDVALLDRLEESAHHAMCRAWVGGGRGGPVAYAPAPGWPVSSPTPRSCPASARSRRRA